MSDLNSTVRLDAAQRASLLKELAVLRRTFLRMSSPSALLCAAVAIPQVADLVVVSHGTIVLMLDNASYIVGQVGLKSFFVTRLGDVFAPLALLENGQVGAIRNGCFQIDPTPVNGASDATATLRIPAQPSH